MLEKLLFEAEERMKIRTIAYEIMIRTDITGDEKREMMEKAFAKLK